MPKIETKGNTCTLFIDARHAAWAADGHPYQYVTNNAIGELIEAIKKIMTYRWLLYAGPLLPTEKASPV
jgi:hypothetical protein